MKAGFPTGEIPEPGGPTQVRGFKAPTPEQLRPLFTQLEIIELLGAGGMGAVYRVRQKELDRIVALKILPPDIGKDPAFAERFSREAKALAKLNHPGIVTIHEFGKIDGLFYFIMEFVDGVNLGELLRASRISPREALAIVPQICDALQYAHDQGIVHRDIKPGNILLDRRGRVKVADFGLAKLVEAGTSFSVGPSPVENAKEAAPGLSASLTDAGKVLGTPQYMAPEQIDRPREVDHRADIYALGVVFYQMLTGELPGKAIEPPSKKVHIDVRLDQVVLRALEKKPELRYQQASALKTQVETIASSPDASHPSEPIDPVEHRRRKGLWYGFIVSCIGVPVGIGMQLPVVWGLGMAGVLVGAYKLGLLPKERLTASRLFRRRDGAPTRSWWTVLSLLVALLFCVAAVLVWTQRPRQVGSNRASDSPDGRYSSLEGYQAEHEVTLCASETLENVFLDFDTGRVLSAPTELVTSLRASNQLYQGSPQVSLIQDWMRSNGVDVVKRTREDGLLQVDGYQILMAEKAGPTADIRAFDTLATNRLFEALKAAQDAFKDWPEKTNPRHYRLTPLNVHAVMTREGGVALVEILEDNPRSGRTRLRYKLAQPGIALTRFTVAFDRASLRQAIQQLARSLQWNVIFDPQLELERQSPAGRPLLDAEVTLRWDKITLEEALLLLLQNYGLQIVTNSPTGIRSIAKQQSDSPRKIPPDPVEKNQNPVRLANSDASVPPPQTDAGPNPVTVHWQPRMVGMNALDWRGALAVANEVAQLPPEDGLAVVREHWTSVTNAESRKQFLKAFTFANHPHLIKVLEMGLHDPTPPVQTWALSYLKEAALWDFSDDYTAAKSWLAARRERVLTEVLAESARTTAVRLREGDSASVLSLLTSITNPHLFRNQPQAITGSGLEESLERLITGNNDRVREKALRVASDFSLGESWYRRVILPLLHPNHPVETRAGAANVLEQRGGAWAIEPLLNGLTNLLSASAAEKRLLFSPFAQALGAIGDPLVIPSLIGLIEADNSYDTVYGVGYFGLSKLTGVSYDEKHDGAWWRAWWKKNKTRFTPNVQALNIPHFPVTGAPSTRVERNRASDDDVADVGAESHCAAGDTNMLYFLISRKLDPAVAQSEQPVLLVLPGGEGGASFQVFIKRITKNALPERYLVAQLVAPKWDSQQFAQVVWPTAKNRYPAMKFTTEEFVRAVLLELEKRHRLDTNRIYTLAWSSSGPAAYAVSLDPQTRVTGSLVAMSVFKPNTLPDLASAKGRAFYLLHSPQDLIPIKMAEQARDQLTANGARVRLQTYEGGHGWHGDVFGMIREGVDWLENKPLR